MKLCTFRPGVSKRSASAPRAQTASSRSRLSAPLKDPATMDVLRQAREMQECTFKPNINKVKNKMYSGENGRFARSGNIWERLQRVSVVLLLAAQIQKLAGTR